MNDSISQAITMFHLQANIDRLNDQIQILIVDDVRNKNTINQLQNKLDSTIESNRILSEILQKYVDKYGNFDDR